MRFGATVHTNGVALKEIMMVLPCAVITEFTSVGAVYTSRYPQIRIPRGAKIVCNIRDTKNRKYNIISSAMYAQYCIIIIIRHRYVVPEKSQR